MMRTTLERAFNKFNNKGYFKFVSDKACLKILYHLYFGKKLDLKNPQTFNEKLQWLKLNNRKDIYTQMVDKIESKKYVSSIIGEEHIIPTLGVWDKFEDIDFDSLPDSFVLKCSHDSGSVVLVKDKNNFDKEAAKAKMQSGLKRNLYYTGREWPYKNVKPRILAEKFMKDDSGRGLVDYKFYCFDGEPKFLYVSQGLDNHATASISFLNMDWTFAPYQRTDYKPLSELPEKPETFDEMVEFCKILSKDIPFLRVDLYQISGKVYFSELTFFPGSGMTKFRNPEHDIEIGKMLTLPEKRI